MAHSNWAFGGCFIKGTLYKHGQSPITETSGGAVLKRGDSGCHYTPHLKEQRGGGTGQRAV